MSENIYLDYAATSPLLPDVKKAMLEALEADFGNPSALHTPGHRAAEAIEGARAEVARLIHAEPEEIIFASGGSEANNTVAHIFADQKVATSNIEHPSVLEALRARTGKLALIPVDRRGFVRAEQIPTDVALVSVMLANNELGSIEPIAEIAKRYRTNGQRLHSDATQALGKIKIDVHELGVDYLTISAHKIGGPVGVGALYVRKNAPFRPLIFGGHQEHKRRAGTANILAIVGFGAAARWCWENWSCRQWSKVAKLRNQLAERILEEVPYSSLNSPLENCLPNILNVSFQAAEGEAIQLYLDVEGIAVSTGSACAAGDTKPSHVLMATSGDAEVAHSSIRFSLGLDTTTDDIDHLMRVLPKIVKRLQCMSTIEIKKIPTEMLAVNKL